jgi:phage gp36-like protein
VAYLTISNLEDRIVTARLNKFIPETSTDRTRILGDIITRAEARIDGYLGVRYQVPVAASGFVQDMALSIAEYEIYRRGNAPEVPEKIRQTYEDVLKDLRDIADGKRGIGGAVALAEKATGGGDGIAVTSDDAQFASDSLAEAGYL